jgi:hypothetical protein
VAFFIRDGTIKSVGMNFKNNTDRGVGQNTSTVVTHYRLIGNRGGRLGEREEREKRK